MSEEAVNGSITNGSLNGHAFSAEESQIDSENSPQEEAFADVLERPEVMLAGAFVGGLLFAYLLKRIADR